LLSGLGVQVRVIGALVMREILTRYGRRNLGFLWLFIEPMLFVFIITVIFTLTRSIHGSSLPIVAFALTGYSAMFMWRNMPGRCIGAVRPNRPLFFHRQVKLLDVYFARVLLEFIGATLGFIALGLIFWQFELLEPPEDVLQVTVGWLSMGWFGGALALLMGALSESYDIIEKIWAPLSYLLIPFSGAAFIADAVPEKIREYLLYLPMLNILEFIREGFFGSHIRAHYDMHYSLIFNGVLTLFALSQVRSLTIRGSGD
jgi:ABC-type polysaccharide/polyol phosphate export permease